MRIAETISLAGLLFLVACATPGRSPRALIPGQPAVDSIRLKASWQREGERQSGRVSWRDDGERGKLLLLDPFNRPVLEIRCLAEGVTILNHRRGRYWQGGFRELLERMWSLSLTLAELREIVEQGRLPDSLASRPDLQVTFSRRSGGVKSIRIESGSAVLRLQVLKRELLPGRVAFPPLVPAQVPAALEEVLARD